MYKPSCRHHVLLCSTITRVAAFITFHLLLPFTFTPLPLPIPILQQNSVVHAQAIDPLWCLGRTTKLSEDACTVTNKEYCIPACVSGQAACLAAGVKWFEIDMPDVLRAKNKSLMEYKAQTLPAQQRSCNHPLKVADFTNFAADLNQR